jgi:hypothetical protein
VGAVTSDDKRWEVEQEVMGMKLKQGSNFGKRLTAMAPVENIVVCNPHDPRFYQTDNGPMGPFKVPFAGTHQASPNGATSLAAPVVTSLVALLRSSNRDLDAAAIVKIVQQGCEDIGENGYDIHTGFGRVNFGKSLRLAKSLKNESP